MNTEETNLSDKIAEVYDLELAELEEFTEIFEDLTNTLMKIPCDTRP